MFVGWKPKGDHLVARTGWTSGVLLQKALSQTGRNMIVVVWHYIVSLSWGLPPAWTLERSTLAH